MMVMGNEVSLDLGVAAFNFIINHKRDLQRKMKVMGRSVIGIQVVESESVRFFSHSNSYRAARHVVQFV